MNGPLPYLRYWGAAPNPAVTAFYPILLALAASTSA